MTRTMCFVPFFTSLLLFLGSIFSARIWASKTEKSQDIGVFHPYCDAGGGGERVLFCFLRGYLRTFPKAKCVVYVYHKLSVEKVLNTARTNFNVDLLEYKDRITFKYLRTGWLLNSAMYPCLTLLAQLLTIVVACEALFLHHPAVFVDTGGFPFTLPVFKLIGGSRTCCYVHYPLISTAMLQRVVKREKLYNNSGVIASSQILTRFKVWYYRYIAYLYRCLGGIFADCVAVNSTWTKRQINRLWATNSTLIYPPCDVEAFQSHAAPEDCRENLIVSLGQFRQEKNHKMQIDIMKDLMKREEVPSGTKLLICGSTRHEQDEQALDELREYAGNCPEIVFLANQESEKLFTLLGKAKV
eukprot:GHVU01040747.1.p1 GENE.GHVU01040747.1~~GHVU01040747.1.p1  ORF type:complete len:356 (-),score=35.07 GHVU01040747.1:84-1151(-)